MVQARGSIPFGGAMDIHFYQTEKNHIYDFEIINSEGITYGTIETEYHDVTIDHSSHEERMSEDEIAQAFRNDVGDTYEQNKHDIYDQFNDR